MRNDEHTRFLIRNDVLSDIDAHLKDDDDYQVARYKLYRAIRHHIPHVPYASFNKPFSDIEKIPGSAIIFSEALERASRELANQINEFGIWIRNLEAWDLVIEGFDEKEIFMLSSEHIEGLTSLAISAPQAIRGQMLYAAVECAALANPFVGRPHDWKGGHIDMKRAKKGG